MEELVRRLIHKKRPKTKRRLKPSEAFARLFGGNMASNFLLRPKTNDAKDSVMETLSGPVRKFCCQFECGYGHQMPDTVLEETVAINT